jgi:predicted metalloprotease
MQWTPGGPSDDLEDRRNESGGGGGFGGFGGGRLGLGGILIVGLLSLIFRHNFFTLFSGDSGAPATARSVPRQTTPQEQTQVQFMSFVPFSYPGTAEIFSIYQIATRCRRCCNQLVASNPAMPLLRSAPLILPPWCRTNAS